MFQPKTERIKHLSNVLPHRIEELSKIFDRKTNVYVDFANVMGWQERLQWHIDVKRLKQFFDSFNTIENVKFYYGTLEGDNNSEQLIKDVRKFKYEVITKPVKIMKISINVSSISTKSPDILNQFIRSSLLREMNIASIESLNSHLRTLNRQGILYLEERKCNFDVEIGRDMLLDYAKNKIDGFILCTGDSDFADPIRQLLDDGKKVVLFATVRKVASELNALRSKGLLIYDIQKIRDFICWPKEIKATKAKRTQ